MNKAYTIPVKDISGDTFRQTLVDREEGLYIGHPTTALSADGHTITAIYPKCHGNGQIVLKRSGDGGITWSERLPVPDSFSTSLEVPTIFRLTDKEGKDRMVLFCGEYPIRMSVSEDDGISWSELTPVGDYGGVVTMGDVEQIGEGEYLALFHDDGRFMRKDKKVRTTVWRTGEGTQSRTKVTRAYLDPVTGMFGEENENWIRTQEKEGDCWEKIYTVYSDRMYEDGHFELYQVISKDGGLTWGEPEVIESAREQLQLCEPCIIRSPGGETLVVLLRENTRQRNSFYIRSDDNGKTWSRPVELPAALTGDRHASVYMPDGRLFITFRDTTHISPTKGDWVAWVGSFEDILEGREGEYRVRIMKNHHFMGNEIGDCAYPGVELLADGTIVTTTYGHFTEGEAPYIVSVRITAQELDQAPYLDK